MWAYYVPHAPLRHATFHGASQQKQSPLTSTYFPFCPLPILWNVFLNMQIIFHSPQNKAFLDLIISPLWAHEGAFKSSFCTLRKPYLSNAYALTEDHSNFDLSKLMMLLSLLLPAFVLFLAERRDGQTVPPPFNVAADILSWQNSPPHRTHRHPHHIYHFIEKNAPGKLLCILKEEAGHSE